MARKPKMTAAFAAFDERGRLLTATVKLLEEDALAILHRFNPPVEDVYYPYFVKPISLDQDHNIQHHLPFEDKN